MKLELGSHFTQTQSGPDVYAFRIARDGSVQIEITPAPPGDPAIARDPGTFLPADSYDYQRAGTFAGFPAQEARTQTPLGNQIQARWGAAIDTPSGICHLRVTSLWTEGPDQMGEGFWTALHDRWLTPL